MNLQTFKNDEQEIFRMKKFILIYHFDKFYIYFKNIINFYFKILLLKNFVNISCLKFEILFVNFIQDIF